MQLFKMRSIIILSCLLLSLCTSAQLMKGVVLLKPPPPAPSGADSVILNFSLTAHTVSGSTYNMYGDPSYNVLTYTAPNGWLFSTVATANWTQYATTANCAADNINGTNSYTPLAPLAASAATYGFFNHSSAAFYNVAKPHFRISNLNPSSFYTISMAGCRGAYTGFDANPAIFTVNGATSGNYSHNQSVSTQTDGYSVTLQPNSSGVIECFVNVSAGNSILALIYGLKCKLNP